MLILALVATSTAALASNTTLVTCGEMTSKQIEYGVGEDRDGMRGSTALVFASEGEPGLIYVNPLGSESYREDGFVVLITPLANGVRVLALELGTVDEYFFNRLHNTVMLTRTRTKSIGSGFPHSASALRGTGCSWRDDVLSELKW